MPLSKRARIVSFTSCRALILLATSRLPRARVPGFGITVTHPCWTASWRYNRCRNICSRIPRRSAFSTVFLFTEIPSGPRPPCTIYSERRQRKSSRMRGSRLIGFVPVSFVRSIPSSDSHSSSARALRGAPLSPSTRPVDAGIRLPPIACGENKKALSRSSPTHLPVVCEEYASWNDFLRRF